MTKDEFRAIRKSLVLTQEGMGRYLGGVSVRTVADWEAGVNRISQPAALLMRVYQKKPELMNLVRRLLKDNSR